MTASFDFAHQNALRSGCLAVNYFGGKTLVPLCLCEGFYSNLSSLRSHRRNCAILMPFAESSINVVRRFWRVSSRFALTIQCSAVLR